MLARLFAGRIELCRVVYFCQVRLDKNVEQMQQEVNSNQKKLFREKYFGRNSWKTGLFTFGLLGVGGYAYMLYHYGPPKCDENGVELEDRFSSEPKIFAYPKRVISHAINAKASIRNPVYKKLLPDLPPPQYVYPKYTLVIEANNVLIHPEWTFRTGWRFKKRPALQLFLQQVSEYYEVVCLTKDPALTMAPVLEQLDPECRYIHYRLFRESTRYKKGSYQKDLSCLNRSEERIVLVDYHEDAGGLHPQNFLKITEWQGDESDTDLIDLAACLRMIAMMDVDDVRPAVQSFQGKGDAMALFRERQQMLLDEEKTWKESVKAKRNGGGWTSKLRLK